MAMQKKEKIRGGAAGAAEAAGGGAIGPRAAPVTLGLFMLNIMPFCWDVWDMTHGVACLCNDNNHVGNGTHHPNQIAQKAFLISVKKTLDMNLKEVKYFLNIKLCLIK
jgi:hypothetical protein